VPRAYRSCERYILLRVQEFEITALLTVLEERFGVDAETADEPNQIEFVGDLIRYIEGSTKGEKLEQTG
jgi:hypothetical protein